MAKNNQDQELVKLMEDIQKSLKEKIKKSKKIGFDVGKHWKEMQKTLEK